MFRSLQTIIRMRRIWRKRFESLWYGLWKLGILHDLWRQTWCQGGFLFIIEFPKSKTSAIKPLEGLSNSWLLGWARIQRMCKSLRKRRESWKPRICRVMVGNWRRVDLILGFRKCRWIHQPCLCKFSPQISEFLLGPNSIVFQDYHVNNPESDKGISSMEDAAQYVYDYLEDNIPDYEWEFPEASFLHFHFYLFQS